MGPIRELLAQRRQQQKHNKQQQDKSTAGQSSSIHKRMCSTTGRAGAAGASRGVLVQSEAGLTDGLLCAGTAQASAASQAAATAAAVQAAGSSRAPSSRPLKRASGGSVRTAAEAMLGAKPPSAAAQFSGADASKVPRPVQLRDFLAALQKVKPAMVDCHNGT
jgi:hypothetical protein